MLILREADVAPLLSMRDAIGAVERALTAASEGVASFPLRTMARVTGGILGAMPGAISGENAALGAKLVSVFPANAARGGHSHQALIALFSTDDGRPIALMDGRYITEIRTAAASAVATRRMAARAPKTAAILGTGVQAHAHIEALSTIDSLREIRVWGRDEAKARALADSHKGAVTVMAAPSVERACKGVQVICTVTGSATPILSANDVSPGTHVNAVGACTPNARELSSDLVGRAAVLVCDSRDGAMNESGDILLAIKDGALRDGSGVGLLGDVLAGKIPGRKSDDEITIFKSLGVATEDLMCARLVYDRATARGVGTHVEIE